MARVRTLLWVWITLCVLFDQLVSVAHCERDDCCSRDKRTRNGQRRAKNIGLRHPRKSTARASDVLQRDMAEADVTIHADTTGGYMNVTDVDGIVTDMPEVTTPGGDASTTPQVQLTREIWRDRMRKKNYRIFTIQNMIMRGLNITQTPNVSVSGIKLTKGNVALINRYVQKINVSSRGPGDGSMYPQRIVVYTPSCDIPPRTHKIWRDPELLRLYFPLGQISNTSTPRSGMVSASLSLYQVGPKDDGATTEDVDDDDDDDDEFPDDGRENRSLRRAKGLTSQRQRSDRVTHSARRGRRKRPKNKQPGSHSRREEMQSDEADDVLRVTIYWFRKPVKRNGIKKQLAASVMLPRSHRGWIEVDVQVPVQRWLKRPNKNLGIEVQAEDANQQQLDPFSVFGGTDCSLRDNNSNRGSTYADLEDMDAAQIIQDTIYQHKNDFTYPHLELKYEEPHPTNSRPKRASKSCVMRKTFVSFHELGWKDVIIAPNGIEVAYCEGHCIPRVKTHYDTKLNTMQIESGGRRDCCGPTELRPFTFLHLLSNKRLSLSTIPDFIVTQCGCRF